MQTTRFFFIIEILLVSVRQRAENIFQLNFLVSNGLVFPRAFRTFFFFIFVTISDNGRHELSGKKLEGPGRDAALEWGKFSGNCRLAKAWKSCREC